MATLTFEEWLKRVDDEIGRQCGLSHRDLADQPYRDWFNDGMSPKDAAHEVLEDEGFLDFVEGFLD